METLRAAFADRPRPLLSYGVPFEKSLQKHIDDLFHAFRIYIICSGSLASNTDVLDRIEKAIGKDKIVGTRIGMKSHTYWSEILEIVNEARSVDVDLILTIGAGSLTDGGKVVALIYILRRFVLLLYYTNVYSTNTIHHLQIQKHINNSPNQQSLSNNIHTETDLSTLPAGPNQRPEIHPPKTPLISIPTTLSAGEYSHFAGATHDKTYHKHYFQSPTRGPELVILDPALTTTTPDSIWLSTGVRAIDHCIETFVAVKGNSEKKDRLALHALGLLVPGLLGCKADRGDEGARLQCQLGSVDAMAACTGGDAVELGASHGIGHQLGPVGVGHGETSCVLLPAVCKFNARYGANVERQERMKGFLLGMREVGEVLGRRGLDGEKVDLGDVLDAVIRELGMPRSLKEVGVGRKLLDELAEKSLQDRWCKTNPVPLTEKSQVLEILEMVLE
ncbi:hypothetical protein BBP40_003728 [Aspergillus hancockii]|nr:hypothetical protein BBP40_003728 [Aspergillus hancockii]